MSFIIADGGKVIVTAQAAQGIVDNVINMDGLVQANSVNQVNGEIILDVIGDAANIISQLSNYYQRFFL